MFAFVSAFPESLHCTDEAQQAETVLSAVLSNFQSLELLGKLGTKHVIIVLCFSKLETEAN